MISIISKTYTSIINTVLLIYELKHVIKQHTIIYISNTVTGYIINILSVVNIIHAISTAINHMIGIINMMFNATIML